MVAATYCVCVGWGLCVGERLGHWDRPFWWLRRRSQARNPNSIFGVLNVDIIYLIWYFVLILVSILKQEIFLIHKIIFYIWELKDICIFE